MLNVDLRNGDCLEVLKTIPDDSVDSIVTDPPYGLSFMNKKWDYDVPKTEVWQECLRVLKPGGHLLAFAGTRTQHRMAVRIEDAGFEIRDMIAWCYSTGFPKSMDVSKQIDQQEKNRWVKISNAIDNASLSEIAELWINSKNANAAGLSFRRKQTEAGLNTQKNGFAHESVLLQASHKNCDALAVIAELNSTEAHPTSEGSCSSAQSNAESTITASKSHANTAESSPENREATPCMVDFSALHSAWGWQGESRADKLKAVEALKIWLGSNPSSRRAATSALCAALTDDLKLITLSQSKTFLSFDTTRQMACASAISATITESTAASLISFTADTLKSKAIDKRLGAEREVVGRSENGIAGGTGKHAGQDAAYGFAGAYDITAPAPDAARQWQGWGTALKPALETVTFASKPYTQEQERDIILSNLIQLEARLWLLSSANAAGKSSTSSQSEYGAACAIAQWSAEEITSTRAALCGQMDMSPFELATTTSLNIVSSWRRTLDESWNDGSTSTTETKSSTTIDWRTLKFSLSRITPESIIKACSLPGGFSVNASTAESHFNASLSLLQSIRTLSATELAISQAQHEHLGAGVKPSLDPCIMARKPLIGTVAANVLAHGTGAINIDGCRVMSHDATETARTPSSTENTTSFGKSLVMGGAGSDLGRFPANLIHDGSDEVVGLFPDSKGAGGSLPQVKITGYGDKIGNGESSYFGGERTPFDSGSGSAARFFNSCQFDDEDLESIPLIYCAKASKADRETGLADSAIGKAGSLNMRTDKHSEENGQTTAPRANIHPTVKPTALMRHLIRLVTPPGGTTLDPFTGSGTTGKAAMLEGMNFVGIELSPEYFEIASKRILHARDNKSCYDAAGRVVNEKQSTPSSVSIEEVFG